MNTKAISKRRYVPAGITRHFTYEQTRSQGDLDEALLVDPFNAVGPGEMILFPGAMRDDGAIIRIPAYSGMRAQDVIDFKWEGKAPFRAQTYVTAPGRYVDFKVPKSVVLGNVGTGLSECPVAYTVSNSSGPIRTSPTIVVLVANAWPAPPPVTVPAAPNGELDFSTIDPEVGLRVDFPVPDIPHIINGYWLTYGRDGRRRDEVKFAVQPGETVHIWRELLQQVERGGEVRIWYYGLSEYIAPLLIGPSMTLGIRSL